jgi:hypothetical protein
MARIFTLIAALFMLNAAEAQLPFATGYNNNFQPGGFSSYRNNSDSSLLNKKWHLDKYLGVSSMFTVFNGRSATVISAPVGLQLNRRLTNNFYAFAGASIAPAYFSMNNVFPAANTSKNFMGIQNGRMNSFGIFSRAEAGLMYVNDERTFSISGSIGVSNYNYPAFGGGSFSGHPAINSIRQQSVTPQKQY